MGWLADAIQEASGPLFERFPTAVPIVYILLVAFAAVIVGFLGFQFLFLSPAKRSETSGPTPINFAGARIEQLTIVVSGFGGASAVGQPVAQPPGPPASVPETIVENGGFEQGIEGWGTGWFEGHFIHSGVAALAFNGATARWYVDDRWAHSGRFALRVEHETPYAPHVFSSFSQRIKVKPGHRYEVKFWSYLEAKGKGGFSLRVVPSRTTRPEEWDRFKAKVDSSIIGRWQEVRKEFESGSDWFFDLRFAAETTLTAWVDDVSVTPLGPMQPSQDAKK